MNSCKVIDINTVEVDGVIYTRKMTEEQRYIEKYIFSYDRERIEPRILKIGPEWFIYLNLPHTNNPWYKAVFNFACEFITKFPNHWIFGMEDIKGDRFLRIRLTAYNGGSKL